VVSGLEHHHIVADHEVHEPVFLVDSTRPCASERMAKPFGFADAAVRVSCCCLEQLVDAFEGRWAIVAESAGVVVDVGWQAWLT